MSRKGAGQARLAVSPYLLLPVGVASVSAASVLIRLCHAHPQIIATWRMGLAWFFLLPFSLPGLRGWWRSEGKRDGVLMAASGLFLAAHFASWIPSLRYTTIASSTLLVESHPLFVAVIGALLLGERLSGIGAVALLVAFGGAAALGWGDLRFSGQYLRGDALALVGGFCGACYLLAGRVARKRQPVMRYAFVVYGVCFLALMVASLGLGLRVWQARPVDWALFAALAVISTIGGHTLYNYLLGFLPASTVAAALLGEPVGATLLGFLILKEQPPPHAFAAGAVILGGVYLVLRSTRTSRTGTQSPD